jgi:hypothetical protein
MPPTPTRKPTLNSANRPITGHSDASCSLKASKCVSRIPSPSAPTSMNKNARTPAENIDKPTRTRLLIRGRRAIGRPKKIVKPAMAPSATV